MRLGAYLDQKSPLFTAAIASALMVAVAVVDYVTDPAIDMAVFYVVPILLVTHRSGTLAGIAMSILAAELWLLNDRLAGRALPLPLVHYWNAALQLAFFILVLFLVAALKRERLSARQDALTGAGNRQVLHEVLDAEIARARRFERPLSCALIDVDRFKSINDSLGHPQGDNVLRAIAATLRQQTRTIDVVARFGGDEFVVLLPETGAAATAAVVRRILKGLDGLPPSTTGTPPITLSIGVVTFERPPENSDEVLRRADAALYVAKRMGGNAVEHAIVQ